MARLAWCLQKLSAKPVLIALFVLLAAPTALEMAQLTPPGQSPDEPTHLVRAAGLLHGAVLAVRKMGTDTQTGQPFPEAGVKANAGLALTMLNGGLWPGAEMSATPTDPAAMMALTYESRRVFFPIPNTAQYFPAAYLPATAGLAIGLALHQPPRRCFQFARYGMAAAYLLLGAMAIFLAPGGESIFMAILLLPISLFLAGTVNEDGVLIAMACLSAACFARDPREHKYSRLAALILLTLILGAKVPYLPLAGLALTPLTWRHWRLRAGQMLCVALPALVWAGVVAAFVSVPFLRPLYHPGPLFAGSHSILFDGTNPAQNLKILLASPARFWTMPADLINRAAWEWGREMIGVLGLLQLMFPDPFYAKWWAALLIAALGAAFPASGRAAAARGGLLTPVYIAALIGLTVWAIIISMYLTWTDVGGSAIEGLQGRYFVLLLPFLALAIPRSRIRVPAIIPSLPVLGMAMFDVYYLPLRVWQDFFLPR